MVVLVLAAVGAGAGCSTVGPGREGGESEVTHVVLFWLKEPGNEAHRARVVEASRGFATIPGVLDVSVGSVVASDRAIVDDSFDVGLVIRLRDERALADYLVHPRHEQAARDLLLPLAEKVVVYDFREAPLRR